MFVFGLLVLPLMVAGGSICQGDGTSYQEIVIAANSPDMVKFAAAEFRQYVKAVCGQELPIIADGIGSGKKPTIFIGDSPGLCKEGIFTEGLNPEGFKIIARPGILAIVGRDYSGPPMFSDGMSPWRAHDLYNSKLKINALGEAGSLYGVYYFLEKVCGIRWYMPGDLGIVINSMDEIKVSPFTAERSPAFNYRYPFSCFLEESPDDALWLRRAGFGGVTPVLAIHNFDFMYKYRDTHPEYFALVDGKRDCHGEISTCAKVGKCHLCLTNPDLIKQFAADICEYFKHKPQLQFFPLGANDGLTRICGCSRCQAEIDEKAPENGKFSNHIWGFVNKVAIEVAKTYPDKYIGCIAYEKYNMPPSKIAKLSPNVAVVICKISSTFVIPAEKENAWREVAEWRKKAKSVYLWDYYCFDNWLPWRNLPVVYTKIISEHWQYMYKLGVSGEFIEAESNSDEGALDRIRHPGMQHLNLYVTARVLWDPALDVKALLDEYYKLFYGPAEQPMRDFWTSAENDRIVAGAKLAQGGSLLPENTFPPVELNRLAGLLQQAIAKTPEKSIYRQRVELVAKEFRAGRNAFIQTLRHGNQKSGVVELALPAQIAKVNPVRFLSRTGEAVSAPTWLYMGYDKNNLYFRFICFEPEPGKLRMACNQRGQDGIGNDDNVEVFLSPDPADKKKCYQFIVNAKGAVRDRRYGFDDAMAVSWNGHAKATVKVESNRWLVDLAVPHSDLEMNGNIAGRQIFANFYRKRACYVPPEISCWSPVNDDSGNYAPECFGTLTFK